MEENNDGVPHLVYILKNFNSLTYNHSLTIARHREMGSQMVVSTLLVKWEGWILAISNSHTLEFIHPLDLLDAKTKEHLHSVL